MSLAGMVATPSHAEPQLNRNAMFSLVHFRGKLGSYTTPIFAGVSETIQSGGTPSAQSGLLNCFAALAMTKWWSDPSLTESAVKPWILHQRALV